MAGQLNQWQFNQQTLFPSIPIHLVHPRSTRRAFQPQFSRPTLAQTTPPLLSKFWWVIKYYVKSQWLWHHSEHRNSTLDASMYYIRYVPARAMRQIFWQVTRFNITSHKTWTVNVVQFYNVWIKHWGNFVTPRERESWVCSSVLGTTFQVLSLEMEFDNCRATLLPWSPESFDSTWRVIYS